MSYAQFTTRTKAKNYADKCHAKLKELGGDAYNAEKWSDITEGSDGLHYVAVLSVLEPTTHENIVNEIPLNLEETENGI